MTYLESIQSQWHGILKKSTHFEPRGPAPENQPKNWKVFRVAPVHRVSAFQRFQSGQVRMNMGWWWWTLDVGHLGHVLIVWWVYVRFKVGDGIRWVLLLGLLLAVRSQVMKSCVSDDIAPTSGYVFSKFMRPIYETYIKLRSTTRSCPTFWVSRPGVAIHDGARITPALVIFRRWCWLQREGAGPLVKVMCGLVDFGCPETSRDLSN